MITAAQISAYIDSVMGDTSLTDAQKVAQINAAKAQYDVTNADIAAATPYSEAQVTTYLGPDPTPAPSRYVVTATPAPTPAPVVAAPAPTEAPLSNIPPAVIASTVANITASSASDAEKAAEIRQVANANGVTYTDIAQATNTPVGTVIDYLETQGPFNPVGADPNYSQGRVMRDPNEVVRNDGSYSTPGAVSPPAGANVAQPDVAQPAKTGPGTVVMVTPGTSYDSTPIPGATSRPYTPAEQAQYGIPAAGGSPVLPTPHDSTPPGAPSFEEVRATVNGTLQAPNMSDIEKRTHLLQWLSTWGGSMSDPYGYIAQAMGIARVDVVNFLNAAPVANTVTTPPGSNPVGAPVVTTQPAKPSAIVPLGLVWAALQFLH